MVSGLAGTRGQLQAGIDAGRTWCDRWRIQANVGPTKTAVMLFAPAKGQPPLAEGDLVWGTTPLPVVRSYKYLGVMLSADCRWGDHVSYIVDKARKLTFALGGILHNRRVATAVRRVVLLAVLRPALEHASTVWCTTAAQQQQLEQVQTQILRRIVGLPNAVANDVLRMELGCRPYSSWMDQRKLEFAFRLAGMQAERLPRLVSAARWPRGKQQGQPSMHAALVTALEHQVQVRVAECRAQGDTAAVFKRKVAAAVRARDVRDMRRRSQSTVQHHLRMLGDPAEHTTRLPRYLSGPLSELQRFQLICRAGILLTAERRSSMRRTESALCTCCSAGVRETLHHALLTCGGFATELQAMWTGLEWAAGAQRVVMDLPDAQQLAALLGDAFRCGCEVAGFFFGFSQPSTLHPAQSVFFVC